MIVPVLLVYSIVSIDNNSLTDGGGHELSILSLRSLFSIELCRAPNFRGILQWRPITALESLHSRLHIIP